jgi:DoxX-like protein
MGWLTILVEIGGGLAVLLGALVPLASIPMATVLLVAMITVHLPYGFSSIKLQAVTAAGAQFGPPGYETDLLYLACLAALVLGGPAPLAIDGLLLHGAVLMKKVNWQANSSMSVESECGAGGFRSTISVPPLSSGGASLARPLFPFPHPAHRTGHADRPHPALGQDLTPSPTTGHGRAASGVRAGSARKGARVDSSRPCVA